MILDADPAKAFIPPTHYQRINKNVFTPENQPHIMYLTISLWVTNVPSYPPPPISRFPLIFICYVFHIAKFLRYSIQYICPTVDSLFLRNNIGQITFRSLEFIFESRARTLLFIKSCQLADKFYSSPLRRPKFFVLLSSDLSIFLSSFFFPQPPPSLYFYL